MLPNQFQRGAKYREGLADPPMHDIAFTGIERQQSLNYFTIGFSSVRAEKGQR
jgi:hypothetical protein